jgi:AraC family transcriptional regulator, transcriptional activator of pobA
MFPVYHIHDFIPAAAPPIHFHINRLEDIPPLPGHIVSPHKHAFYELFLLCSGEVRHLVDYEEYLLKPDTFFFISQGQLHFWTKGDRAGMRGYRLMFTEDFFRLREPEGQYFFEMVYLNNIFQRPDVPVSPQEHELVYTYFDLLHREYTRSDCQAHALQSLLYLLLAEVRRLLQGRMRQQTTRHQVLVFRQFMQLLEQHFQEKWGAAEYAAALCISSRHLQRIVQEMTGQNLTRVILHRSMLEARRLLGFSQLTVGQVADHLGYEDAAYFARQFRQYTGMSPSGFRAT